MDDFLKSARLQLGTSDFDAEHPLYMRLMADAGIRPDSREGYWLSFLYMAYYDEASAWVTFNNSDPFTVPKIAAALPIGTNRRNLFGERILAHLESLRAAEGSAAGWPLHNFTGCPRADWELLKDNICTVWGNGRFARYTTAEMIQKVNLAPVEVTDFDNDGSSKPADAIDRLFGCGRSVAALDAHGEIVYNRVRVLKARPAYTKLDRGVVESILCNYSGLCRGVFYSGRNLDRQQARILKVEGLGHALPALWEARGRVFKKEHLGEHNGWVGIDRDRLTHYRDTGELLWVNEGR
jgi:hypothetical protein